MLEEEPFLRHSRSNYNSGPESTTCIQMVRSSKYMLTMPVNTLEFVELHTQCHPYALRNELLGKFDFSIGHFCRNPHCRVLTRTKTLIKYKAERRWSCPTWHYSVLCQVDDRLCGKGVEKPSVASADICQMTVSYRIIKG